MIESVTNTLDITICTTDHITKERCRHTAHGKVRQHNSTILLEIIKTVNKKKKNAFIDFEKAFDCIDQDLLFFKL